MKMLLVATALGLATLIIGAGIAGATEDGDWGFVAQWRPSGNEPAPTLYYDTKRIEADHDIHRDIP
jgi:hypothetical protein